MSATGELISRIYSNFRGVDFRGEEINLVRSPDSLNVWKDYKETESIRTRPAMEFMLGGKANSFTIYKDSIIAHQGTTLYKLPANPPYNNVRILATNLADVPSNLFVHDEKIYIMDGEHYLVTDGSTQATEVVGYVPTTTIGRKPSGGGTIHEDVNMLQPKRRNAFAGDGESRIFSLDTTGIEEITGVWVDGELIPATEYAGCSTRYYDENLGAWVTGEGVSINTEEPPPKPFTDGQDNVVIEFKKTIQGYREQILKCTVLTIFDNRVFVSGNPDYPNYLWHCSLRDPTYFSDKDYYQDGMDTAKIKGVVAGNNALWVFREPSTDGTTVFYHTPTIDDEYGKVYPSVHSSAALGCVGKAINFNDDIVFFSERGMEGISGDVTTEQVVAHRSSLVDRKMLAEKNYKDMVLAEWEGYLFVFIGNKAYLADSRTAFTVDNHIEYEWFYWEMEKEIRSAVTCNGMLYLGTDDGIYTLTDYDKDIEAYWTTPKDKFKYPHMLKTTNKRGCVAEATGDITVYAKVEDTGFELIGEYKDVQDYFVSRIKRKKFKDIQLKFHSNTRFSLETVTLEAWIGGYIKR